MPEVLSDADRSLFGDDSSEGGCSKDQDPFSVGGGEGYKNSSPIPETSNKRYPVRNRRPNQAFLMNPVVDSDIVTQLSD